LIVDSVIWRRADKRSLCSLFSRTSYSEVETYSVRFWSRFPTAFQLTIPVYCSTLERWGFRLEFLGNLLRRRKESEAQMGLTSKQHLFARVYLVVILTNAAVFYSISRNPQAVTSSGEVWQIGAWVTIITLFVLTVNLEFWWRYQRRTDNLKFSPQSASASRPLQLGSDEPQKLND
jgi:hypothetical protein